ncbi:MAG: DNA-directed RNA polymerase subunit B [Candidatus Woesearchaeota archaeon]|jgi:DNA-directed RNA polymerase beta subunit|nr:DNA-directed RNA polymerase subunit B [Candidatus Woesearchaeota archaeon]
MAGDIFFNDVFAGTCSNPKEFVENFKKARRAGEIDKICNAHFDEELGFVYIDSTPGRIRRPLIIVVDGVSKFTKELNDEVKSGKISFEDLVDMGVIEYIDTLEEEGAYFAFSDSELTLEHTHLEITPITMFGINTAQVPFLDFDEPSRLMRGQKTIKQAVGTYALNYLKRVETDRNLLINPQKPLVETFIYELLGLNHHPAGQNTTVAIMSFEGYNMEDGLILNKSSIERGLQRSFYYKKYSSSEIKYPGGLQDRIAIPSKDVKGYSAEIDYRYLEDDGIIYLGQAIKSDDILIGKISPPRFIEEIEGFGQMINLNVDSSLSLKEEEFGVVSSIHIIENVAGDKEVNVLLRTQRGPIVGDKFASRHGQKGVIGALIPQADMPFSENGIVPDLIFSPHSIPGRKTVSHVMEVLAGKVAALRGEVVDGNAFDGEKEEDLRKQLKEFGFESSGTEVMYHPKTGKRMEAQIYVGSLYYLRLKHQVENKIQARGTGPVQLLTRQPAEGRIRGGGLKLGEMEKDALISHGAALLLKERFSSDQTTALVCKGCGFLADPYMFNYRSKCPVCNTSKFDEVELAYAFKLFINELKSMGINPSFGTQDRFFE